MKYTATQIRQWDVSRGDADGNWRPARPITYWKFRRFKLAWLVLIGQYDALDWEE